MKRTIKNFLTGSITYFDTEKYFSNPNLYYYRIYPVEDNKTIKIRVSTTDNTIIHPEINKTKIILKIKILEDSIVRSLRKEIITNRNARKQLHSKGNLRYVPATSRNPSNTDTYSSGIDISSSSSSVNISGDSSGKTSSNDLSNMSSKSSNESLTDYFEPNPFELDKPSTTINRISKTKYISKIIGVYRLNAKSFKTILNNLPNKHILDLSEFIQGDFLLSIYNNYENIYYVRNDFMLMNKLHTTIPLEINRNRLFFSFLFLLFYLHQNNYNTLNVELFNIGLSHNNSDKLVSLKTIKGRRTVPLTINYEHGGYIEPILIDYVAMSNGQQNVFKLSNFMPFDNSVLYKNITDDTKYPYLPIDLIKKTFGTISSYVMENLCWIAKSPTSTEISVIDKQILYLLDMYDLFNGVPLSNNNITNVANYNMVQTNIIMNCHGDVSKCFQYNTNNLINDLDNLEVTILPPDNTNPTKLRMIPDDLKKLYQIYNNQYGIKIFGPIKSTNDIDIKMEIFTRRVCLSRYWYSQLKNSYLVSRTILEDNYNFFEAFLDEQINKLMNLIQQELYTIDGKFQVEIFVYHFLSLSTDYILPSINNFDYSNYLEESYVTMIYDFITSIISNGNIRNKLFVFLALSKIIHLSMIRKIFMVFYVKENSNNSSELLQHGINNNKITMDKFDENIHFEFDANIYCQQRGLNINLIEYRYTILKELVPLKQNDIGTNNLGYYLFRLLDNNIKHTYVLYMYEDFKYCILGRIRFDKNKVPFKDYTYIPKNQNILYPKMDLYEFHKKHNEYVAFLDRGMDTQRMSVLDHDNIFIESFRQGEPVLSGASGHTADILLCAGYLEPSNSDRFINKMKLMTILCVSVMFPRKDHSIFEMYRALQLFNKPMKTNEFTCPVENINTGSCFKWLLSDIVYNVGDNQLIGNQIYNTLTNRLNRSFEYYLSPKYYKIIEKIIEQFYKPTSQNININKFANDIRNIIYDQQFNNINDELFIIMTIIRREGNKIWMNDAEYAYNIENKHISMRNFIDGNYSLPDFFTDDDIFLYEDNVITCTRSIYDFVKPVNSFDNTCLILQKIFWEASKPQCIW